MPVGRTRPSYYRGARHDYVYYPESWIDESTGVNYQSGYYDENGQRYDTVSFAKNGTYENVVCRCEYCSQDVVVNLSADDAGVKSVNCPNCGAPMTIRSQLDESIDQPTGDTYEYRSGESSKSYSQTSGKKKHTGRTIVIAILVLLGLGRVYAKQLEKKADLPYTPASVQQLVSTEDTIALRHTGGNSYETVNSGSADKTLVWDADADSYYDADTECWLWRNTDVSPAVWQYWYEGISSDFGDYGWMEHDADGWWIEASYGEWIQLPDSYDISHLWYILD